MTLAEACVRASFFGVALSAFVLARPSRLPSHRFVAHVLLIAFICDCIRPFFPLPLRRSLFLAFPALSALLAFGLPRSNDKLLRSAGVFLFALWALGSAWFVLQNFPARDPFAIHAQGVVRLGATIVELVLVAIFALQRRIPTTSNTVVLLLVAGDVGELVGPWAAGATWGAWELARWQWTIVYCVVCMVQLLRARWLKQHSHLVLGSSGSA